MLSDGTMTYTYNDHNGSVIFLTQDDPQNPTLLARYDYDPYGRTILTEGPLATTNPFRHATKYHDPETQNLYYTHRYYQPHHQTWLTRDPIQENGGINLYAFVNNDPINSWDYLGMLLVGQYMEYYWEMEGYSGVVSRAAEVGTFLNPFGNLDVQKMQSMGMAVFIMRQFSLSELNPDDAFGRCLIQEYTSIVAAASLHNSTANSLGALLVENFSISSFNAAFSSWLTSFSWVWEPYKPRGAGAKKLFRP